MPDSTSITLLTKRTGWYGRHSGYYEQLPEHLKRAGVNVRLIRTERNWCARLIGGLYSRWRGLPRRDQSLTAAELRFVRLLKAKPVDPGMVLNLEDHVPMLQHWPRMGTRITGVIHFPRRHWEGENSQFLCKLRSVIVLYRADLNYFESLVGNGRAWFIRHGVDTEFFRPADEVAEETEQRLLCVGQFQRNFDMLARVALQLLAARTTLHLDLVLAPFARSLAGLDKLRDHPRIRWHSSIDDEQLKKLYQHATLLLLPMDESGANNAIVEAMACGLTVLTTDVGGVRDYGGGTIYPVVENNDDGGMIRQALHCLDNPDYRKSVGRASRVFAEEKLAWETIAREHMQVLSQVSELRES